MPLTRVLILGPHDQGPEVKRGKNGFAGISMKPQFGKPSNESGDKWEVRGRGKSDGAAESV